MSTRIVFASIIFALGASAAVVRVEVTDRSDVLQGRAFGNTGAYERVRGKVFFAVDPGLPANRQIVDAGKAPRNSAGLVEFAADFYMLQPRDLSKGNRTVLYESPNRGGKGMLGLFNRAAGSPDPTAAEHFGDGLLLEDGYTLLWLGWQHDVPARPELLRLMAPAAKGVTGWVRSELTPEKPVSRFSLGDSGHAAYPVTDPAKVTVTVRDGIHGERRRLDAGMWRIENATEVVLTAPAVPGQIIEVVYESSDPVVAGLGLAAIRDMISYLKYGGKSVSALSDHRRVIRHAIAFGSSQSAMMLKALVYEGFNADERGRRVFDGVFAHVAGGRRSTFQRFAQNSRTAGPMRNASFSPSDQFPFADVTTVDAAGVDTAGGGSDGLLARAMKTRTVPKMMYTNSSYEYWGSSGALLHVSPDGKDDIALPRTSRLYLLAGGQHGPAAVGSGPGRAQNAPNSNDYRWIHRALLQRLQAWVAEGKEPPASQYPTLSAKTLVPMAAYSFPAIPNVTLPRGPHASERLDFGPAYRTSGVIAFEPPRVGKPFAAWIPQSDKDGIDVAGVKMPWVSVPVGTFTGWNLRSAAIGASDELLSQTGSFFPFARTRAERDRTHDPRLSMEERYSGESEYLDRIREAGMNLAKAGYLLERDVPAVVNAAKRYWSLTAQTTAGVAAPDQPATRVR